jgi:hypothetical protein
MGYEPDEIVFIGKPNKSGSTAITWEQTSLNKLNNSVPIAPVVPYTTSWRLRMYEMAKYKQQNNIKLNTIEQEIVQMLDACWNLDDTQENFDTPKDQPSYWIDRIDVAEFKNYPDQ